MLGNRILWAATSFPSKPNGRTLPAMVDVPGSLESGMTVLNRIAGCALATMGTISVADGSEPSPGGITGLPAPYHLGQGGCRAGRGYSFVAQTPNHPSTYPKLLLRIFNGEIIGMVFEADAAAGWKPWYDQPAGKPVSHGDGPAHYSQAIYIKAPPTAADCAKSSGPGKMHSVQTDR